MRLVDNPKTHFQTRVLVTIFLAAGLAACGSTGRAPLASISAAPATGPQANYPILVGDPYEVGGTTYTPADVLNYDEVGYLTLESGTMGSTGAHHTLPVPSYAEVTSLETGRTVLVRLERRGPMASNHIVALSPAAMAQLGGNVETPVRVRRVNPPEDQWAMLRRGNAAPLRMDTPSSLLTVLQRRLPESGTASLAASAGLPRAIDSVEVAASSATTCEAEGFPPVEEAPLAQATVDQATAANPSAPEPIEPVTSQEPVENSFAAAFDETVEETTSVEVAETETLEPIEAPQPVIENGFVVQAAAFANPDNARRAANVLGGAVTQAGEYHRVRTGPFATRGEAEASLANVQRAGYSDARILTSG